MNWAVEKNIFSGIGGDLLYPDGDITREQLALVLYGFAETEEADMTVKGNLADFKDAGDISHWSKSAVAWAVGEKIIVGDGNGYLKPKDTATRAEVAAIFESFMKNIIY